jgi:hypothetical protein
MATIKNSKCLKCAVIFLNIFSCIEVGRSKMEGSGLRRFNKTGTSSRTTCQVQVVQFM